MTAQPTHQHVARNGGFPTYCFVIRSCLEQDLHEAPDAIAGFMEKARDRLFGMYSAGVPAAAALLALAHEYEIDDCHSW